MLRKSTYKLVQRATVLLAYFQDPFPSNHDRPGRKSFRTGEHRQNTLKIKFSYFLENPWRGPLFRHSGLIFWF